MTALRVLHVVGLYPTESRPSSQVFISNQIESLRRLDSAETPSLECDVLVLQGHGWRKYASGPRQVRARLRERPADLIHAHFSYCGLVSLGQGIPVVVSFLGTDIYGPVRARGRSATRPLHRLLARIVSDHTRATIVKSERMKSDLGMPCEVIPNGVDFSVFFPPTPQAPDSTDLRVLFAGAPTNPIKRHALAAAAVEYAQSAIGRPVRLVALHDRPQHEVADAMRGAQLLLLTSTHEGSPNVVKEAIACALPVVTLDVGDVRERLAECPRSIVVASETPETIGNAVLHVLRCGKRDQGRDSLRPLELMTVAARIRDLYIRALAGS